MHIWYTDIYNHYWYANKGCSHKIHCSPVAGKGRVFQKVFCIIKSWNVAGLGWKLQSQHTLQSTRECLFMKLTCQQRPQEIARERNVQRKSLFYIVRVHNSSPLIYYTVRHGITGQVDVYSRCWHEHFYLSSLPVLLTASYIQTELLATPPMSRDVIFSHLHVYTVRVQHM